MNSEPILFSADLGKGFRVGEYTITGTLGHGAMATVYLARDRTGHDIALKVFRESPGVSHTMLERFRREAEATKKLRRHPYILTVYDTGQEGPYHYIAMEQIQGSRTLDVLMSDPAAGNATRLLTIGMKIANALAYAHEHQIVHRDVKPANIMIDEFGEPLLADFGVAELIDWPSCTVSGALTGTPMYMSPEQARAERVGPASDVYSLAVVLYEGLTGKLPYDLPPNARTADVLEAVKTAPVIRPRKRAKNIRRELEFVLLKALQKDPRDRYAGMREFAQDLECLLEGRPVRARLLNPVYQLRLFLREHRTLVLALGAVVLAGGVAAFILLRELRRIHTEQLLGLARTRNLELRMASEGQPAQGPANPGGAWQQIRNGRQMAAQDNWAGAAEAFKTAADLSRFYKDGRTSALATIEQGRAELMLARPDNAVELFRIISTDPASSPALAEMALFEACARW
ncbi:MAG: serine/threonine-protein kinase [Kiritimatiellia bacterium]